MSDSNINDPLDADKTSEWKSLCADLQSQVQALRVLLLFVIGSLCLFFWREAGFNGSIAQQLEPQVLQASQIATALSKQGSSFEKQLQAIQGAVARLVDYGKTHPDYVAILNKHGISVPNPATPAAAPASPPATAPAAPKK